MAQPDAILKAASTSVALFFAILVFAAGPRKPANQFLAAFLALVAGNQGAETLRALPSDPATKLLLFRVATAFAALDPGVLYYFVSIHPGRNRLHRPLWVALAVTPGLGLASVSPWLLPGEYVHGPSNAARIGLGFYTFALYTIAFVSILSRLLASPGRPELRSLYLAMSCVTIVHWVSPFGAVAQWLALAMTGDLWTGAPILQAVIHLAPVIAGLVSILALAAHERASDVQLARTLLEGVLLGASLLLVLFPLHLYGLFPPFGAPPSWREPLSIVGRGAAALRWILFGGFISLALLRHDLLGIPLSGRRRAARVLVGGAFLIAAAAGIAAVRVALGGDAVSFTAFDLALVGVAVALSQGFRSLVDRVAAVAYGVPAPGDPAAAMDAYRAALAQAGPSRGDAGTREALERFRAEIGLEPRVAAVLDRMSGDPEEGPLLEGRVVRGRYRILRLLGRGGTARAFVARDELLDRDVVLKEVLAGPEGDEAAIREAKAAGSLRHPNVAVIHDVLRRKGATLIVTEHASGGDLATHVHVEGPLGIVRAIEILDGVLAGLEAVHAKGIIHRDLKPANVVLDEQGTPKIVDFGIARVRSGGTVGLRRPGDVVGTPAFMAPEQRRGELAGPATDVYAAGLLLQAIARPPLPAQVREIVQRAMAEDPSARWQTAGELRAALRGITLENELPVGGPAPSGDSTEARAGRDPTGGPNRP